MAPEKRTVIKKSTSISSVTGFCWERILDLCMSLSGSLSNVYADNGQAVDPLKVKSPPVNPVDPENMESFNMQMTHWRDYLDKMIISDTSIDSDSDQL